MSHYTDDEETEKLRNDVEEDPDRYEPIPKAESSEDYEDMEDFIADITSGEGVPGIRKGIREVLYTKVQNVELG